MNLYPERYRIVVRNEFSQEEFERFGYFERWGSYMTSPPGYDPNINYEDVSRTPSHAILIRYRDDAFINLTWAQVEYADLAATEEFNQVEFNQVVERLKQKVPTYSLDELQVMFDQAKTLDDQLFALYAICVNTPWAFDLAYFQAVDELAQHVEPTIRAAVTIGIGYIGLTEYEAILERLQADSSPEVQARARQTLAGFVAAQQQLA